MFNLFKKDTVKGKRNEDLPIPNEGLPDSYRPSGLCPRCGKQSSFEIIGSLPVTFDGGIAYKPDGRTEITYSDRVTSLVCRHCKQGTVVVEEEWVGEAPKGQGGRGGIVTHRGVHWWPLPQNSPSNDIPKEIAEVYSEAVTALMANCPRASAVMSRRTLEAITESLGEANGTLAQRLAALSAKGVLLPTLSEWAKEVRLIGNNGAHFDPIRTVSMEDAKQLVDFMGELLKYLFELPAELNRRRNPTP